MSEAYAVHIEGFDGLGGVWIADDEEGAKKKAIASARDAGYDVEDDTQVEVVLIDRLTEWLLTQRNALSLEHAVSGAIDSLRSQLAQAKADLNRLSRAATRVRQSHLDYSGGCWDSLDEALRDGEER